MNIISFLEHINKLKQEYRKMSKKFNHKNLGLITKTKYIKDPYLHFSNLNDVFTMKFDKPPRIVDLNKQFKTIQNWNEFIRMHVLGPYISLQYVAINYLTKTDRIISDYYFLLISLILNKVIHKFSDKKRNYCI